MSNKRSTLKISAKKLPNLNDLVKENQRIADQKVAEALAVKPASPERDLEKECRQKAFHDFLKTPEELRLEEERRKEEQKRQEVRDHFFLSNVKPNHRLGFRSVDFIPPEKKKNKFNGNMCVHYSYEN